MSKKPRGKAAKKIARLEGDVTACRHDVAHALDVLRLGAHREFTFLPKGEKWLLPSVAFGLGLALAGKSKGPAATYARRDESPRDTSSKEDEASSKGEKETAPPDHE